jgi:hypothetical protein
MPVVGIPKFNAVVVLDIDAISFARADVPLVAHAAFVNTEDGNTYGETTCSRWSPTTMDRLKDLRASMEQDVATNVFTADSTGVLPDRSSITTAREGIGEHANAATDTEQA